ncbi:LacI family DNA-binding transcriptional regulator [Aureibacillus halotolerans]|uniref:LacI family transcriptional regulator n=1 Tax=Aureibacillus halotolerans TaxID=1508390 RepID=A0A4R6TUU7_9BACI|nr:LacI family DNA-binding transcriptional regulator [Aureibacillus halotolerans]TDQ37171.1 LacI family transcriptional regulator [Aureibacillus halotolerans]
MGASIKDVARRAGVSVTSVSRVLNGEKYVSKALLEKVNRSIEELNYSPSHIARSLKMQKTNTIGIIVPDLTNQYFSTIISHIEETATTMGYNLLIGNIAESMEKELKYLRIFQNMRVDGIIVMHQKFDEQILEFFANASMPILFLSVKGPSSKYLSVMIDDYRAAFDATEYLIRSGHRKVAFLSGDLEDITSGLNRYRGFIDAMKKHRLELDERFVKFGNYKLASGRALMEEIVQLEEHPTVVFAASDDMAVGALNCVLDHGFQVPDDISIVGYDGSQITEVVRPSITSMEQPSGELGRQAVDYMHQLIVNPDFTFDEDIILPHQLVLRGSSRELL